MSQSAELLSRSLVWDNHGCMPLRPGDDSFLPQLERYRAAGVDMAILNIGFGEQGVDAHVRVLASFRRWLKANSDLYAIAGTVGDVHAARAAGKLAIAFDIEGANGIADDIGLIGLYYDLGVRWMLMAYNRNNRVGGGCHDSDAGLSNFGKSLVREMERVGMIVCCTHTGHKTATDVLAMAEKPVIFSHSNARAVHDHQRNIPDDLIRACAATGGVICTNGIGIFLGPDADLSAAFVRHVDHVVQLVGPEHAGIGLDHVFDQQELEEYLAKMKGSFPPGMGYEAGIRMIAPEALPTIVEGLIRLGYPEAAIAGILGGNMLRVAGECWK